MYSSFFLWWRDDKMPMWWEEVRGMMLALWYLAIVDILRICWRRISASGLCWPWVTETMESIPADKGGLTICFFLLYLKYRSVLRFCYWFSFYLDDVINTTVFSNQPYVYISPFIFFRNPDLKFQPPLDHFPVDISVVPNTFKTKLNVILPPHFILHYSLFQWHHFPLNAVNFSTSSIVPFFPPAYGRCSIKDFFLNLIVQAKHNKFILVISHMMCSDSLLYWLLPLLVWKCVSENLTQSFT